MMTRAAPEFTIIDAVTAAGTRPEFRMFGKLVLTRAEDAHQGALHARQLRSHQRVELEGTLAGVRHRSHILSYVDRPGGTQGCGLFGTPDQVARGVAALRAAGVDYVLINGGRFQRETLRRFARHVMPAFAS